MTFNSMNRERSVTVLAKYKELKAKHPSGLHTDQELFELAYRIVWTDDLASTLMFKQTMGIK